MNPVNVVGTGDICILRFSYFFNKTQGDHSPVNVKFPDIWPMLSVTYIMPVLVLLSVVGVRIEQCMICNQNEMHKFSKAKNGCKYAADNKQFESTFPWQDFSPDIPWLFVKSLTFPW